MKGDKLLKEEQGLDFHLLLTADNDNCTAYLEFSRLDPGCEITVDMIESMLDSVGIVYGVDKNNLRDIAERISAGMVEDLSEVFVVASGKQANNGQDGWIEFRVNPSPEQIRLDPDELDRIDYKNTNLIENVRAETDLGTVHQPTEAENGIDIFGNTINASEGNPVKVRLGMNVVMDGDKLFSTASGRFVREGDELSVNPIYHVRGDVDLTIGNINFIGLVQIQKDVFDDFTVVGREGIEIGGIVGAAKLESDKNIIVSGGVNGKGKGYITATGKIESKYFNDVIVVCRSDITISKQIMNSVVKTKGKINIQNGTLLGGEISAQMGIDAGVVGSELGTPTTIIAGQDFELMDRLKAYVARLEEIGKEINRIDRIIGPVLANKNKLLALPTEKKKALKGLLHQMKQMREEKQQILKDRDELQSKIDKSSVKEIYVRKMLYQGVRVYIGKCNRPIKMEIRGPICLREDLENDTISITNLTL